MINYIKSLFKREPKVWFTSDLHFGHKNVITYCDRPWKDKEEMNEALVKLWNEQVKPGDKVYVLGDFSLSPKMVQKYAPRLNGDKILVCGNHDAPFGFKTNPKAEKMRIKYLNEFKEVHMETMVKLKNGQNVLLAHMPYKTKDTIKFDTRYLDQRPVDKGLVLLHGHLHCRYLKMGRLIDVGIDNNYRLYSEDDIISLIDLKQDHPSRLTEWYKTQVQRHGMKGEEM